MPDSVREAFEAESTVQTPEECHAVWLAQMPVFSDTDISHMFADVHFRPEAHHEHELGELHALPALAAADIPVLAIGGANDRWYPPPFAERIADTAKHGELLIVPGGHFPFAEDPVSLLGRGRGLAQQNALTESLNSFASSTSDSGSTTASSGVPGAHRGPGRKTSIAVCGSSPATRALPSSTPSRMNRTSNALAASRPRLNTTAT